MKEKEGCATLKIKAVGLLSGGLDSTLSAKILLMQGIEIYALNFYTGFCIAEFRRRVGGKKTAHRPLINEALRVTGELRIPVERIDISLEYMKMVTQPKYGYGANINPCIDCRIYMLRYAREYMLKIGAHFVFTGEVLAERPMSQHRHALEIIEKESSLEGRLLRPLSAKLLPPTIPEQNGWVDREKLYAIQGRGRNSQIALAEELGIQRYLTPSGGCCFLTDKNYARKFRDLMTYRENKILTPKDVILLGIGRHFRLSPQVKIIVGRNEAENKHLSQYGTYQWIFEVMDHPGPIALVEGEPNDTEKDIIAGITSRYSDVHYFPLVKVRARKNKLENILTVPSLNDEKINSYRI